MSNCFGEKIKVTIYGESHGKSIGCIIDGLPAGIQLDFNFINKELERRAPGKNKFSTQRKEKDNFIIESGYFNDRTTGTPLCVRIENNDTQSKDYSILKSLMRPSHGDYPGNIKYKGFNDYRGGGSFSGRITAPLVFVGAISKLILKNYGIYIGAHILSIKDIEDKKFNPLGEDREFLEKLLEKDFPVIDDNKISLMKDEILKAKEEKNSIGGIVECIVNNIPVGLGSPFFDSVESKISHGIFSIPSIKAIEFGEGFNISKLYGNEANDEFYFDKNQKVKTKTNNNGGILGGLTTGMPIIFRVAIKPTPSISLPQNTINITTKENEILEIHGRHDPCIVPRVVPVIEGITAWIILDMILSN
ncbi:MULTISPECIES: chorismate synthase [Fusobacterium]|uniref:chorismate synthase n=1 Tax=Fusobacterium TaxID=848 RepID=UPI0014774D49|nr:MULTISPECIES: chorismate synthase [Fusobacterium]NME35070.1 chorismate synthase [Fusobacterium sp. FSA-380-WT-3A]